MRQRSRQIALVTIGVTAAALLLPLTGPAQAQTVTQAGIVSDNPVGFTPDVLDGKVEAFAQVGGLIIAGGSFSRVQNSSGGTTYTRNNIVAFDAASGQVSTTFAPTVSGEVYDIEPAGDGSTVYVAGAFTSVGGSTSNRVVRLNVTTGAKVAAFAPPAINGIVKNVDLVDGQLLLGGTFSTVGGVGRGRLASLDPTTGARTDYLTLSASGQNHGGGTQVLKMAVAPNGTRLVVIGNFTAVAGQPRLQIAMIDLTTSPASLTSWSTGFYTDSCSSVFNTYMRDLDFAPDSSYFVVSTTGAYHGSTSPCDVITRWETNASGGGQQATWRDYTGGDTTYAVAVTGAAVYVGGHMRWLNNPYAGDDAGPGSVPREGIAALDPVSGLPLSWNPGRARGVGVFDMLATSTGLWVGSDTDRIGGETHRKIAFFPLAGGTGLPEQKLGTLPGDVYTLGQNAAGTDPDVLFRVNAGGPEIQSADDGPNWVSQDAATAVPGRVTGQVNTAGYTGGTAGSTVPDDPTDRAPAALFDSEAWGGGTGAQEMGWHVPVPAGQAITVRLYLANRYTGTSLVGQRQFDVSLDGTQVLDNFDPVQAFGDQVGGMRSFTITSDGTVDITFTHVVENPLINGIEIIRAGSQPNAPTGNADVAQKRGFDGVSAGTPSVVPSSVGWGSSRGAFLVDNTLYVAFADGTFTRRTFDGATSTFGSPTTLDLYAGSFGSDLPNLTGLTYAHGRIYYTLAGDNTLHWRWFSPESDVVGATPFDADGANGSLSPSRVRGMFLDGSTLFFVDSATGHLLRIGLSGTTVSGSATAAEQTQDWRARSIFLDTSGAAPPPVNHPPTATASVTCENLDCHFSSAGSNDPDGDALTYEWVFGDGGTSTLPNPSHTYTSAGDKSVTLTVTDLGGLSDDAGVTAHPSDTPVPPTAAFTASCSGLSCTFTNTSTGSFTSSAWVFGDGGTSTLPNPSHAYSTGGTYTVTLTVNGAAGQDDVTTQVVVAPVTSSVAFRGGATGYANKATVPVPAVSGAQSTDVLLLFVTSAKGTQPATAPAGWTFVGTQADGSDTRTTLYRRLGATGGLGTVTWPSATKTQLVVLAYAGAAEVPSASVPAAKTTSSSTSFTAPATTVATSGSAVVSFWALRSGSPATWTTPAGTTERTDSAGAGGGQVGAATADQLDVAAGSVAARTATSTVASAKGIGWTVVLGPAV